MSAESMTTDPYEVVLADLRLKKAQIEQAISAIETLRGGVPSGAPSTASVGQRPRGNADIESPGAFLGMSIVDATKKLLAAKRQPLRNPDIAAAFKRGGLALTSKEPANTIGSVLTRRQMEVGDVVRVDRGTWGLKEWYPNRNFNKAKSAAAIEPMEEGDLGDLTGAVKSVPFMITEAMRDKLRTYGASDDDIKQMTPEEARSYIVDFEKRSPDVFA